MDKDTQNDTAEEIKQQPSSPQPVTQPQAPVQTQEENNEITEQNAENPHEENVGEVESVEKQLQEMTIDEAGAEGEPESQKKSNDEDAAQSQEYYTRDFIEINRNNINFNRATLFPGSIDEVEICINIKEDAFQDFEIPKGNLPLRVVALCNEAKFNDLDEYVFSVRDNDRFQYFQEVMPMLNKNNRISVKVAVKIPVIKQSQVIEGTLSLQLLSAIPIFLSITAKCQIPQIVCLKQLFDIEESVGLIKIPAKKNMRMPPLPFKNLSSFNFMLEAETISNTSFANRAYDVTVSAIVNCSANTPFFVNIQLKPNLNYKGMTPKTDILRKVLVLKLKNSSVCFSYPIEVYVFESANGSSVS